MIVALIHCGQYDGTNVTNHVYFTSDQRPPVWSDRPDARSLQTGFTLVCGNTLCQPQACGRYGRCWDKSRLLNIGCKIRVLSGFATELRLSNDKNSDYFIYLVNKYECDTGGRKSFHIF